MKMNLIVLTLLVFLMIIKGMESRNVVAYCHDEKYYEPVNCEHDKCVSYCMKLHGEDFMSAQCLLVDDVTLNMDYCQCYYKCYGNN